MVTLVDVQAIALSDGSNLTFGAALLHNKASTSSNYAHQSVQSQLVAGCLQVCDIPSSCIQSYVDFFCTFQSEETQLMVDHQKTCLHGMKTGSVQQTANGNAWLQE